MGCRWGLLVRMRMMKMGKGEGRDLGRGWYLLGNGLAPFFGLILSCLRVELTTSWSCFSRSSRPRMLGLLGQWGLILVCLSRSLSFSLPPVDSSIRSIAVIKLLGFKDESELAFEDNVKHSFFIYPDEMVCSCSFQISPSRASRHC